MRSILTVPIRKFSGEGSEPRQDLLAVEEPLEIRIETKNVAITMRTPGHDAELAAGFLFTEGIVQSRADITNIQCGKNSIAVELRPDAIFDIGERHFYINSSCGVCGKASIEALQMRGCPSLPRDTPTIDAAVVHRLPETLREAQSVFDRTGGLHAAGLFDASGNLLDLREDVGRHNAVDKLIGAELLQDRVPLSDRLVLVSGRASFELVQKTLMAGVPMLAAVGAPSSLAVETAMRFQMTLLGFVRDDRFNIYSGAWRIRGAE